MRFQVLNRRARWRCSRRCSGLTRRRRRTRHAARGTCCTVRSAAAARRSITGFMHDSVSSNGTPSSTPRLITSVFLPRRETASRFRSRDRARATAPAPSPRRTPAAHPETDCRRAGRARCDARRGVAATTPAFVSNTRLRPVEVDVFVGRVIGRRHAADRPVRRRIDIAHRELDARQRLDALGEHRRAQQPLDHRDFRVLPTPGRR